MILLMAFQEVIRTTREIFGAFLCLIHGDQSHATCTCRSRIDTHLVKLQNMRMAFVGWEAVRPASSGFLMQSIGGRPSEPERPIDRRNTGDLHCEAGGLRGLSET